MTTQTSIANQEAGRASIRCGRGHRLHVTVAPILGRPATPFAQWVDNRRDLFNNS